MVSRDLHDNIIVEALTVNQSVTATTTSSGLDTQEAEAAEFLVDLGAIANIAGSPNPSITLSIEDSADDVTYAAVTDANYVLQDAQSALSGAVSLNSSGEFALIDAAAEDGRVWRIGYRGPERYARIVATASAEAIGATPLGIIGLLHRLHSRPGVDV